MAIPPTELERLYKRVTEQVPYHLARLPIQTLGGGTQAYVRVKGGWYGMGTDFHFLRCWISATTGDYVEFDFYGNILIVVFTGKSTDWGIANVYVDDKLVKKVDLYATTRLYNHYELISDELGKGKHTVRIEVSGEKNPSSAGYTMEVQGILVDPKVNLHADIWHEYYIRDISESSRRMSADTWYTLETTTPLGAGAEYVGTSIDRRDYTHAWYHAMAFADVDGTIYIDQSHDGTNWDYVESQPLTGGAGAKLSSRVVARYVRIRYLNGVAAQTTFRFGRRFTFA